MNKILVFTNYISLATVDENLIKHAGIPLIQKNTIIVFDKNINMFIPAKSINDGEIFFISDEVNNIQSIENDLGISNKHKIGVLKHRKPDLKFEGYDKVESKGIHGPGTKGNFFPEVLKILTDDTITDKFSALQKAIWGTDNDEKAKELLIVDLLNQIYSLKPPTDIPSLPDFKTAYDSFILAYNALQPNEQDTTNCKFVTLVKQLKRDIGI